MRYSHTRTDTLIGVDLRFEGNLTFTGVLLIQGDTVGDISCAPDSDGTAVVGRTGNATGTIKAPHIVVGGRIHGPVHSSESIEVQQGAHVAGDVCYKAIDIHAGGVIEGLLIPVDSAEGDRLNTEYRIRVSESPAVPASAGSPAGPMPDDRGFWDRLGAGSKLGGAVALLVAAIGFALISRDPASVAPPVPPLADSAPKADSATREVPQAQPSPTGGGGQQDIQKATAGDAAPLVSNPEADTKVLVQASPPDHPGADTEKLVMVQGVNPGKPAAVFLVIAKEPSVLYRKKRQDPSDGTRINVAQGATESVSIGRTEIFRVAKGRDLTIFYQGKKVAPKVIESGAWMSFVPQPASEASERK